MGFKICILAHGYNSVDHNFVGHNSVDHNFVGNQSILHWFQTKYPESQFALTKTTDETVALDPHLVIVLLLKYNSPSPYERLHTNIRDIAPKINRMNTICFGVIPDVNYNYSEFIKLIPDDIKNDSNDYTELFDSLGMWPNNVFRKMGNIWLTKNNTIDCVGFNRGMPVIFFHLYKQKLICYFMVALRCNILVTHAIIHHLKHS
jgi:hypothetical protein